MSTVTRYPAELNGALSADVTVVGSLAHTTVIPTDADGVLVGEEIVAQSRQALENLVESLALVGAGLADVAHLTIYLTDIARDRGAFNEVYAEYFGAAVPVRCAVGVAALARPEMLVELTAVAAVPGA